MAKLLPRHCYVKTTWLHLKYNLKCKGRHTDRREPLKPEAAEASGWHHCYHLLIRIMLALKVVHSLNINSNSNELVGIATKSRSIWGALVRGISFSRKHKNVHI